MRVYYCDGCGRRVSEADLEAGHGIVEDEACYCAECAPAAQEKSGNDFSLDEAVGTLDEGVQEVPERSRPPRTARRRPQPPAGGGGASVAVAVVLLLIAAAVFVFAYGFTVSRRAKQKVSGPDETTEAFKPTQPKEVRPEPVPVTPSPPPEPPEMPEYPEGRRPLGEDMPTPDIDPAARPTPPPPAPAPEPPAPEPAFTPTPAEGGWISVFDGQNLGDWRAIGTGGHVENGALVTDKSTDLYYQADWAEFTLKCELKAVNPDDIRLLGIGLATPRTGRGSARVTASFFRDGDIHVRVGDNRWKSGGGTIDLRTWTPMTFKLTRNTLEIYKREELIGNIDISSLPVKNGGLYFFSYKGATARMRNPQVKVISR